jgi:hypothetical protein
MKILTSLLAITLLGLSACHRPHHSDGTEPEIVVVASRKTMMTGETTRIQATTINLPPSGGGLQWSVSPTTGTVNPDAQDPLAAFFTSNQVGTYVIRATVQRADGSTLKADTRITVNGPMRDGPGGTQRDLNRDVPRNPDGTPIR